MLEVSSGVYNKNTKSMKITEKNIEVGTKDAYMFVFIIYI